MEKEKDEKDEKNEKDEKDMVMETEDTENQIKETLINEPTAPREEMDTEKGEEKRGENRLSIHLGDILRILSPTNLKYHDKIFLVDYCGKQYLRIVDVESGFPYELKLLGKEHDSLEEKEGIFSIELLSREKYPGYAKQNGLVMGVWVDVEFGGELPFLVTGMITNLEEDQIEITTWSNLEVFYLDFRYEGLLEIDPKIEKIQIRDAPSSDADKAMEDLKEESRKRDVELEDLVDGEKEEIEDLGTSLAEEEAETNQLEKLREEYVQGTAFAKSIIPEIEYGEVLGNYYQRVEQRKEEIRYSLNAQIEDFMNELLSTIPNYMRSPKVMEQMEYTLKRFRELHEIYARTNDSGVVTGFRSNRYRGKPLVSQIFESSTITGDEKREGRGSGKWLKQTGWIIPVVHLRKKGWHDMIIDDGSENYNEKNNDVDGYFNHPESHNLYDDGKSGDEWVENPECIWLKEIQESIDRWIAESGSSGVVGNTGYMGYKRLLKSLDEAMRPVFPFTKEQWAQNMMVSKEGEMLHKAMKTGEESLRHRMVDMYESGVPIEAVVDNTSFRKEGIFGNTELDEFYSTVSRGIKDIASDYSMVRRRFVIQKHVDALSLLSMRWSNSGKKILERETAVENEKMLLKSILLLPEPWMIYSQIHLPMTNLLTRVRLGSWYPQMSRILNKYTSVESIEVDDLTRDYAYSNISEERCGTNINVKNIKNKKNFSKRRGGATTEEERGEFLSGICEYQLAKENVKTTGSVKQPLETMLNTIIPNNLYLIDFMCPYLNGSEYSLTHYAHLMEPFGIYPWNMRYAEAFVMQKKIRDKMADYRVLMENGRRDYAALAQFYTRNHWTMKYRNTERFFHWIRMRGEEFITSFLDWYHLNIGPITTSETIKRIYELDNGELYGAVIRYFHYALITLNRFTKTQNRNNGGVGGDGSSIDWLWKEEGIFPMHGGKRSLAKRYHSLKELHEDDHRTDLVWDKSLDSSPYHLATQYGDELSGGEKEGDWMQGGNIALNIQTDADSGNQHIEIDDGGMIKEGVNALLGGILEGGSAIKPTMRQKLSTSQFLEYLAMNLRERHLCPAEQAVELANILINGKRPVKEGEYASVQLDGGDVGYYKRRHHTWERDTSLDFGKEMEEKRVFSNLEKLSGGLGVMYGSGKKGEEKGGVFIDEREVVTLSGDAEEAKRIAKWEEKKTSNMQGGAVEKEEIKRQKELDKEMFQQKIQQSLKALEEEFEKKMKEQIERTIRIYALKEAEMKRANTFAFYLGKYKKESETRISPHAPLLELILEEPDFVLKQQYIMRFYHAFCREPILNGAMGTMGEEKSYWKYCSETNVPVLPTCYYDLALEFTQGGDYGGLLEKLCSTIGDKSSDGEAIIDRYTGRVLKKLDLDVEEGFDEMGFQRKTREVLGEDENEEVGGMGESSAAEGNRTREKERKGTEEEEAVEEEEEEGGYLSKIGEILASGSTTTQTSAKKVAKTAQDYGEGDNEKIARISFYFLQEMGLFTSEDLANDVMDFVIPLVSDLLVNKEFIETEKRFEQKRKLALEKGKPFPFDSYDSYKNQKLLYSTIGALLIGIQTITTEVKMTRNYTSCIRSLRGYPTGLGGSGKEDKSALRYVSCILLQQQSDEAPWNARNKGKKEDTQMNVVVEYVDKFLLGNKSVEDRIGLKRAHEIEHGTKLEEALPLALRIDKKPNLLPPMEKGLHVEDRETMMVSREFLEEWKTEMRKSLKMGAVGNSEGVVRGKLMALGGAVFEHINTEVAHQVRDFLMKTALGDFYLENACCQGEGSEQSDVPLRYFMHKNQLIAKALKTSRALERTLEKTESLKKSILLYHAESTRIGNGEFWDRGNGSSYFKANIYEALIHYFHYDRPLLPVPEYLRGTIYEEPPKDYPIGASLKEKIEFLERAGRHYDVEKLQYCLTLVGQQNILSKGGEEEERQQISKDSTGAEESKMGEALGDFLTSSVFETSLNKKRVKMYDDLIQKITDVFREWKRGTMQNSTSTKIRALNAYLATSNANMFERISKEWKPSNPKERELLSFLERIQLWSMAGDIEREHLNRSNSDSLQQIVRFIKDMCNSFAFVYTNPGRLSEMRKFMIKSESMLPKHWGFAKDHYSILGDYICKTYKPLTRNREETDNSLFSYFKRVIGEEGELFEKIRQLMRFFPVFTPLSLVVGENGEREVFYSLFPKETCYGVHVFCLYFILSRYLEVSDDYELNHLDKENRKQKRLWEKEKSMHMGEEGAMVTMSNAIMGGMKETGEMDREEVEDYSIAVQENWEEQQIMEGRRTALKSIISRFFYDYLEFEKENKEVVDVTYEELRKKQENTEKREKKRITDRLKNMEIYERRVENHMKDLKLGNWNVGSQKGLFQYDKETFKREMIEQQYGITLESSEETGSGRALYDTEMGDLGEDYLNGEEADRLRDMELNGEIMALGEDWDDGGGYD